MWNDEQRMEESFNLSKQFIQDTLKQENISSIKGLLTNCVYLEDSQLTVCGINIYGSPW